ncbi:MAG TPA: hypothetical protein VFV68_12970 [Agriterribacter sp.]|nr:hypothetical protein [Agriterribacter sp.]
MKNYVKFLSVLLIASFVFLSCSKDDAPADNDLFVGTYNGTISYLTPGETKSTDNGKVTVVKVGNNYNFVFSNDIPDLKGVQFKKDGDNTVISVDDDASKFIRITASKLSIAYTKDQAVWTADCDR